MISRNINGVKIDIDEYKANAIYLEQEVAEKLKNYGLSTILEYLYSQRNEYIPLSLTLELTNVCNFSCPFCYIHTCNQKQEHKIRFNTIKEDLEFLIENGLLSCTITGGECFSHPDFSDIYKYLKQRGVIVTILTNLSLLTENILNVFKKYPPYKIDVSVYGISDSQFRKVTGRFDYKASKILNNILLLKNNELNVTCKTPINTLTKQEYNEIKSWCLEHCIRYYYSSEVFENYEGICMEEYSIPINESIDIMVYNAKDKYPNTYNKFAKKKTFDCKGGKYGIFISHDYILRPCLPFYGIHEFNIRINEYTSLKDALLVLKSKIIYYQKFYDFKYCDGCYNQVLCNECVINQIKYSDNLKNYMLKKCKFIKQIDFK